MSWFLGIRFVTESYATDHTMTEEKKEMTKRFLSQKELGRFRHIREHLWLGGHNSFENYDDCTGSLSTCRFRNRYEKTSMVEQLEYGWRYLNIDIHKYQDEKFFRVGHSGVDAGSKRLLELLSGINKWLELNREEIIIIELDTHIKDDTNDAKLLVKEIESAFGGNWGKWYKKNKSKMTKLM